MTTIAVTGATGHLGRLTLDALKTRAPGATLVALARNPAAVTDEQARAFDYTQADPQALAGVDVLVLISSSSFDDRAGQHRAAIDAARAARVGRVVYTSILKGDASPMKIAADHVVTESHLRASGLPFTILRNGWYTENYTGSLGGALQAGAMIGAAGEGRIASAARADYAEAAAVAAGPGHDGMVYELAGDTGHTMAEMAAEVSRLTGRAIPYNSLPEAVYAGILESFGLPPGFAALLADADAQAAHGALVDDSRTLSRLIGRPTTPMAKTVAAAVAGL
ncbi:MAG: NAD(P)H-binding protein [Gemmobacter sp.]